MLPKATRAKEMGDPWAEIAPFGLRLLWSRTRGRALEPLAHALGSKGDVPDRLRAFPRDPRQGDAALGAAILEGRFRLAGATLETLGGQPWGFKFPSERFRNEIQSFHWLRDMSAAIEADGTAAAQVAAAARQLIDGWIEAHLAYSADAWRPEIAARRAINWIANAQLLFSDADKASATKILHALALMDRFLGRVLETAGPARSALTVQIAYLLTAVVLGRSAGELKRASAALTRELKRQILPDGGHKSRSPAMQADILADLVLLEEAFEASATPVPRDLQDAIDGMMPMLRFFEIGGSLAAFHGSGAEPAETIARILAAGATRSRPLAHAPHFGYQRIEAGDALLIADVGGAAPIDMAEEAHAAYLSFEFAYRGRRILINCGRARDADSSEERGLRISAAHTTLSLGEASPAHILNGSLAGQLIGPRLVKGPRKIECKRHEESADGRGGTWLDLAHDGYAEQFGRRHMRRLYLQERGEDLRGEDSILPIAGASMVPSLPFRLRFHIHPDVRVTLANGETGARLGLPDGSTWRFQCKGGEVGLADSICYGPRGPNPTKQIVVRGEAAMEPYAIQWALRREAPAGARGA